MNPCKCCDGGEVNENVNEWGGVPVSPAIVKTDDVDPNKTVPEIGSITQGYDGRFFQRVRATLDKVLSVAEFYFRAGEDPVPEQSGSSTVEDSLRVHGAEVPRQVQLQTTTLPAYPIFTGQPPLMLESGVTEVTFTGTYTRGAVGGQARVKTLTGNGFREAPELVLDTTLSVSQPNGRENAYLFEVDLPIPQDDGPMEFVLPVRVPRGQTSIRMVASEIGVPGTPGTMEIELTAGT